MSSTEASAAREQAPKTGPAVTSETDAAQTLDSLEKVFFGMQNKLICALEVLLPEGFDFSELERLFDRRVTCQLDYGLLILNLLDYFIQTVTANLIKPKDYCTLEEQTQKLEAEIRNHIKIEQSIKIYLEIKLRSLDKYKKEAAAQRIHIQQLEGQLHEVELYYQRELKHINQYLVECKVRPYEQTQEWWQRPKPKSRHGEDKQQDSPRRNKLDPLNWNPECSNHRYHSLES